MPYIEARGEFECAGAGPTGEEVKHMQGSKLQSTTNSSPMMAKEQQIVPSSSPTEALSDGAVKTKSKNADAMEDVTFATCPPSQKDSGAVTTTKRVSQCPARLRSLLPPSNFGAARSNAVYRSAFPQDRNVDFVKTLHVRTVLCLVATEPSKSYSDWIEETGIKRLRVDIAPNKDGQVSTTWDSLCEALLQVLDAANYPIYVHCNQGRHRTGCVIACLRRVQRWPIKDILAEYKSYADPKARPGDIALIKNFDPSYLFEYAQSTGFFEKEYRQFRRMDSGITNVDMLAEALSSTGKSDDLGIDISGISSISNASTVSDEMDLEAPLDRAPTGEPISTAAECTDTHAHQVNGSIIGLVRADELVPGAHAGPETTATVVELSEDAMTPPAIMVPNPLA